MIGEAGAQLSRVKTEKGERTHSYLMGVFKGKSEYWGIIRKLVSLKETDIVWVCMCVCDQVATVDIKRPTKNINFPWGHQKNYRNASRNKENGLFFFDCKYSLQLTSLLSDIHTTLSLPRGVYILKSDSNEQESKILISLIHKRGLITAAWVRLLCGLKNN